MIGFMNLTNVSIPKICFEEAYGFMRRMGEYELEGVALFAGNNEMELFRVTKTVIPDQKSYTLEEGLLYSINSEELYRLNKFFYEEKLSLIAQIHSHPGRAYHSETDDAYPIVTVIGGLSIVVPDFASKTIDLDNMEVFRLSSEAKWECLNKKQKKSLIEII